MNGKGGSSFGDMKKVEWALAKFDKGISVITGGSEDYCRIVVVVVVCLLLLVHG